MGWMADSGLPNPASRAVCNAIGLGSKLLLQCALSRTGIQFGGERSGPGDQVARDSLSSSASISASASAT